MRRLFILFAVAALSLTAAPALPETGLATTCYGLAATQVGNNSANVLMGTPGVDIIQGNGGDDTIMGLDGHDVLCGGTGNDTIEGGNGRDMLLGGPGNDTIRGNKGADGIAGKQGFDIIYGGSGRDLVIGNQDTDTMFGRSGDDYLEGNLGFADLANGGIGHDWCKAVNLSNCEGPDGPFLLKYNGLGPITFGTPTDTALVEFALLGDPMNEGDPDEDSGWVQAFNSPWGVCPGDQVRMVRWGNVRTFFTRVGLTEGEFFTWQVIGTGEDKKLSTGHGARIGDTRAQLELAYWNDTTVEFVDPFNFWRFYVNGNPSGISGTLGGGSMAHRIKFMQGGIGCGE